MRWMALLALMTVGGCTKDTDETDTDTDPDTDTDTDTDSDTVPFVPPTGVYDACPTGTPATATLPLTLAGNRFAPPFTDSVDPEAGEGCDAPGGAFGAEALIAVDLDTTQVLTFSETSGNDFVFFVTAACPTDEAPAECLLVGDDPDEGPWTFHPATDGVYWLVINTYGTSNRGYALDVDVTLAEVCTGGADEDGDDLVDCADPDCFGHATDCTVETGHCLDGADNDGDEDIDCDDADCAGPLACSDDGTVVLSEGFATWPATGWTVVDGAASDTSWGPCDDCGVVLANADGPYAYVDSDAPGVGTTVDTSLVSPVVDLSDATEAVVRFTHYYRRHLADVATVEYTTNGGTTWTVARLFTESSGNGDAATVDIGGATGSDAVQIRFHYTSAWDWYWLVDTVSIEKR